MAVTTRSYLRNLPCNNCGQNPGSTDPYSRIELDHIVPLSRGGSDDDTNLQPLCGRCNRFKNNMTNSEAALVRFTPTSEGTRAPWPRGWDWTTNEWTDGDTIRWVNGNLFAFPLRSHIPAPDGAILSDLPARPALSPDMG